MYQQILVALDGSSSSDLALGEALRLAATTGGALRLFHAMDDDAFGIALEAGAAYVDSWRDLYKQNGEAVLARAAARVAEAGISATTQLSEDVTTPMGQRLVAEAHRCGADLIVIGTHGRRGVARLLFGSVAEDVLRQSDLPVLVVRLQPEVAGDADARAEEATA